MIKVNLFFMKDSSDMKHFLSGERVNTYFRSGLIEKDWNDNEGTALFVDETILPRLKEVAAEYELEVAI
jgi:hypothetical protein